MIWTAVALGASTGEFDERVVCRSEQPLIEAGVLAKSDAPWSDVVERAALAAPCGLEDSQPVRVGLSLLALADRIDDATRWTPTQRAHEHLALAAMARRYARGSVVAGVVVAAVVERSFDGIERELPRLPPDQRAWYVERLSALADPIELDLDGERAQLNWQLEHHPDASALRAPLCARAHRDELLAIEAILAGPAASHVDDLRALAAAPPTWTEWLGGSDCSMGLAAVTADHVQRSSELQARAAALAR